MEPKSQNTDFQSSMAQNPALSFKNHETTFNTPKAFKYTCSRINQGKTQCIDSKHLKTHKMHVEILLPNTKHEQVKYFH